MHSRRIAACLAHIALIAVFSDTALAHGSEHRAPDAAAPAAARGTPGVERGSIAPIDEARVEHGFVVAGDVVRERGQLFYGGEFRPYGEADGVRALRIAAVGEDLGNGFSLMVGGIVRRTRPVVGARSDSVTVGALRFHRAFLIVREARIELVVDASASLSALQVTRADAAVLREIDGGLRWCASQSDAGVHVGIRVARAVEVTAGWEIQDDPFHTGDGSGCIGNGPVWTRSETLDAAVAVRVSRRLRIGAHVVHRRSGLGWDVEQSPGLQGEESSEGTTVMLTAELAL